MNLFNTESQVIPVLIQLCVILVTPAVLCITAISYTIKRAVVILTKYLDSNIVNSISSEDVLHLDFNSLHKPYSAIPVLYRLQTCPTKDAIIQNLSSIYSKVRSDNGMLMHWKLSVYPVQRYGWWFWRKDESFNFHNQIKFLESRVIDSEDEICSIVSKIMRQRFHPKRPLWDITVVPYTRPEGSVTKSILIFRLSHCIIDGLSFMKLYYRLAGYDRLPPDFPAVTSKKDKSNMWHTVLEWSHGLFTGMYVYSCLMQKLPDCNAVLNLEVYKPSGEWILTSFPTIPLTALKTAKITFNCTFNDIILCGIFGGLQNYMKKHGSNGICPSSIHCLLAVPKPDHPDDTIVNHLYSMIYEFPMNVKDRIERVKSIQIAMKQNGIRANSINKFFQLFLKILNALPISSYIECLTNFQGCTVQTSLVPSGNKTRLPPIFGAQVDILQYWMPISRETAAAFTWGCITGNDSAWMTLTADSVWIKSKERLDELAKMIYSEFNSMCNHDKSLKPVGVGSKDAER